MQIPLNRLYKLMKKVAEQLYLKVTPLWIIVWIVATSLVFLGIAPMLERLLRIVRVVDLENHIDNIVNVSLGEDRD